MTIISFFHQVTWAFSLPNCGSTRSITRWYQQLVVPQGRHRLLPKFSHELSPRSTMVKIRCWTIVISTIRLGNPATNLTTRCRHHLTGHLLEGRIVLRHFAVSSAMCGPPRCTHTDPGGLSALAFPRRCIDPGWPSVWPPDWQMMTKASKFSYAYIYIYTRTRTYQLCFWCA